MLKKERGTIKSLVSTSCCMMMMSCQVLICIQLCVVAVPRKHLPPVLHRHKLAKGLAGLQTLVGAAVLTVSSWIHIYTPSLSPRDIPFWSGLPVSKVQPTPSLSTQIFKFVFILFQLMFIDRYAVRLLYFHLVMFTV